MGWDLLRHWHGTYMAKKRVPIATLSHHLRHADVRTTLQYYMHMMEDDEQDAVRIAASLLKMSFISPTTRPQHLSSASVSPDLEPKLEPKGDKKGV